MANLTINKFDQIWCYHMLISQIHKYLELNQVNLKSLEKYSKSDRNQGQMFGAFILHHCKGWNSCSLSN